MHALIRMEHVSIGESDETLKDLHELLETAPYAAAEQVILLLSRTGLTEKQSRRLLRTFAKAALRIAAVEDALTHPSPTDHLFVLSLQFWQKERIAVLLLRLLCSYADLTTVRDITSRVPVLFDEVFESNLYRMAHLDAGTAVR